MKKSRNLLAMAFMGAALALGLGACSDEDSVEYSANPLKSTELMTILKQKGYAFSADGKLELNDLAKNTTTLDLSGTKVKAEDLAELSMLPALTDLKISDNGYYMRFDFSNLPAQITGVDLSGNELYEFPGLAKEDELGNVTLLRPNLKKLYLPNGAKYNEDEIVNFYLNQKDADMQMADANGKLQKYNTLREVPDETLRSELKRVFPSTFVKDDKGNDVIDISKRISNPQEAISPINFFKDFDNLEGVQYIIHNKGWKATAVGLTLSIMGKENAKPTVMPYLKIPETIEIASLSDIDTPNGIDISACDKLYNICIFDNPSLKELDLSNSTRLGQRGAIKEITSIGEQSFIFAENCPNLEKITLPEKATILGNCHFLALPNLQALNLQNITSFYSMDFFEVPAENITFPTNIKKYKDISHTAEGEKEIELPCVFGISKEMFSNDKVKAFIAKNKDNLDRSWNVMVASRDLKKKYGTSIEQYNWTQDIQ